MGVGPTERATGHTLVAIDRGPVAKIVGEPGRVALEVLGEGLGGLRHFLPRNDHAVIVLHRGGDMGGRRLGGSKEIYRGRNHIVVGGGIAIVHDLSTQRERRGRHHRRGTGEGDGGATKGSKGFGDLLGIDAL